MWVLAEGSQRVLERPERVARLLDDAERLQVTDLFVQVQRQGRSWFPSTHADPAPFERLRAAGAADPLGALVDAAHARGVRVHAWFNALCVHENRGAPVLRSVGRDAVLVDRRGRSMLDYPDFDVPEPDHKYLQLGTPGLWLDPGVPGVIEWLEGAVDDLVAAAPGLDGLHLDFIRHPYALPIVPGSRFDVGIDFGYGAPSRSRFERANGGRFERGDAWDEYRRERVTEVVARLGAHLPEKWEYSAAVLPWAERAYQSAMQDWRRWLDEGLLDFAVAMTYTRDDRLLRYLSQGLVGGVGGERVWLGLGSWMFANQPARAQAQAAIALASEPAGVAFFSWDALVEAPEAAAALVPGAAVAEP
jgi:uncharacterized lipoprotein YddW (UPF0748 family)